MRILQWVAIAFVVAISYWILDFYLDTNLSPRMQWVLFFLFLALLATFVWSSQVKSFVKSKREKWQARRKDDVKDSPPPSSARKKAKADIPFEMRAMYFAVLAFALFVLSGFVIDKGIRIFNAGKDKHETTKDRVPISSEEVPPQTVHRTVTSEGSEIYVLPIEHNDFRFSCFGDAPCPDYKVEMSDTTVIVRAGDPSKDNNLPITRTLKISLLNPADGVRQFYIQSWTN